MRDILLSLAAACFALSLAWGIAAAQDNPTDKQAQAAEPAEKPEAVDLRLRNARALAQAPNPAAQLLAALRGEPHAGVRAELINGLAEAKDKAAVPALLDLAANDPDTVVRTSAIIALHKIGDRSAWDRLEALAQDPNQPASVRRTCVVVVSERKGPKSLGALKAAAQDKEPEVRAASVHSLGRMGHPDAKQELEKALLDKDEKVRKAARKLLDRGKKPGKGKQ